ncbi:MAG TPA: hypothetical protein VGR72_12295 [Candidatus Acidoferrales bacterium]|nr:hypothetical protein [Candidatus Acidoferrales bacterium]
MRRTLGFLSIASFVLCVQVASAQDASQSQSQSQSQTQTSAKPNTSKPQPQKDSVAEAARKAREEQKNAPKAPAPVVFTNDNIGATAASGTVNVVGNASAAPKSSGSASTEGTTAQSGKAAGAPGAASASSENDEASWRQRFADARNKLKQDQDDLAVMQRELANLRLQYYPDPSKAMKQSVSNEDVYKKQQAIDKKQKEVQADQQALSGLEDELRKAGGDPSWARE